MNFRQEWQKELQVLKYQKTNVASPNKTENNAEDGDDEVKVFIRYVRFYMIIVNLYYRQRIYF